MTALLSVEGVSVGYGGALALDGVSLTLAAGETVAVLGANGAGKSSLLKAILGLVAVSGVVRFAGEDVTALPTEWRVGRGLGYVPEGRRVFAGMSVRDNLEVAGLSDRRARTQDVTRIFDLFPDLARKSGEAAWRLSGGQQQMLSFGRALMGRPRLLLLDEPSLGLSPKLAGDLFAAIQAVANAGTAVLVAEQSAARALSIAPRALLLRLGRVVRDGPVGDLSATVLHDAFFGL
jgi:branched-chain amino acid transport system ATP-binding protein